MRKEKKVKVVFQALKDFKGKKGADLNFELSGTIRVKYYKTFLLGSKEAFVMKKKNIVTWYQVLIPVQAKYFTI